MKLPYWFKKLRNFFTFNKERFEDKYAFFRYLKMCEDEMRFGCGSANCPLAAWAMYNGAISAYVDIWSYKIEGVWYDLKKWQIEFIRVHDRALVKHEDGKTFQAKLGLSAKDVREALIASTKGAL